MNNTHRQDATISICKHKKNELITYLSSKVKIGKWVEEAITEKMENERNGCGNVVLERNKKGG